MEVCALHVERWLDEEPKLRKKEITIPDRFVRVKKKKGSEVADEKLETKPHLYISTVKRGSLNRIVKVGNGNTLTQSLQG